MKSRDTFKSDVLPFVHYNILLNDKRMNTLKHHNIMFEVKLIKPCDTLNDGVKVEG